MPESHVYKEVDGCEISLDIHRPSHPEQSSPAIIFIHGGALINGSRDRASEAGIRYTDRGYTVFSIDYRRAPETKLPEIVSDVEDALAWVRQTGSELTSVNPDRIAVVGHSAGGYLTLMSGTFTTPPKALVSLYGYGDIVGRWYSKPDPFYCTKPMVSEAAAREHHDGPPVTQPSDRPGTGEFYLYCRQQGVWPNEVGGRDPEVDPGFFIPYCPEQNITTAYPPTMMLHGTADTDVPYAQSVSMSAALTEKSIVNHLVTIEEGGHGFDADKRKSDPDILAAWDRVYAFLDKHV
jgi:acetyl esterase/lipase